MQLLLCEEGFSSAIGTIVRLPSAEARHATSALRMVTGDHVLLSDGRGRCARTRLHIDGAAVSVVVEQCSDEPAPNPSITVVQALTKGEHGELAIDQMTQVGVDRIIPWASRRSIVQLKGERADRAHAKWLQGARTAAKQSRRSWLPAIDAIVSSGDLAGALRDFDRVLLLHEDASRLLATADLPNEGRICVIVGPEGGIAPEEIDQLTGQGADCVRLGPLVLRSSLAGAMAVGLLSSRLRWSAGPEHGVGG